MFFFESLCNMVVYFSFSNHSLEQQSACLWRWHVFDLFLACSFKPAGRKGKACKVKGKTFKVVELQCPWKSAQLCVYARRSQCGLDEWIEKCDVNVNLVCSNRLRKTVCVHRPCNRHVIEIKTPRMRMYRCWILWTVEVHVLTSEVLCLS